MRRPLWVSRRYALAGATALTAGLLARHTATARATGTADVAGKGPRPGDLRFTVTDRFRPVDLLPPRFARFERGRAAPTPGPVLAPSGPVAPFATVVADVAEEAAAMSVSLGLTSVDGRTAVRARYEGGRDGRVAIEVVRPTGTTTVATAPAALRAPFRLAFTLTGDTVSAFVSSDDPALPWRPLLTDRQGVFRLLDLRDPRLLSTLRYSFHTSGVTLRKVRAGYFGQLGLRDLHVVREVGGRPYVRDGRVFFVAGCAGAGFSQAAHAGVWAMDPEHPARMEPVAKLFFARDGLRYNDHGGQILHDPARDRFIVVACGGNLPAPGVRVYHTTTEKDVLNGVHVLDSRPLDLPYTRSAWDPALVRSDGRWHWAFVDVTAYQPNLSFHPVLATAAPNGDYHQGITLTHDGRRFPQLEGCRWQRFDGTPYLLTSDRAGRRYPVHDLALRPHGYLDAPYPSGTPFPGVFPWRGARDPHGWRLVTFDESPYEDHVIGYGTHGAVVAMRGGRRGTRARG
ncbi:hypothetical protein [Streptomyces sp. NPDC003077]|uniref:hypothetical protein n=1 Tax=Streptomyces sp. NPDC003077 TaxID=3154443 RepID=UPI0033A89CCA